MKYSILFYAILWLTLLPVLYINILVYRMAKREPMILSWELKIDSIFNVLSAIHHLVFLGIVKFAYPAFTNLGEWYCHISTVILSLDVFRTSTMTFSIGVYRYIFIVHGELMSEKRKKQIRMTLFITKVICIVLFTSKFVIFHPTKTILSSMCGESEFGLTANYSNATTLGWLTANLFYTVDPGQNTMVTIFGKTENGAVAFSLKVFCIIVDLLFFISIFNITEGVLHYHIGKFLKT